MQAATDRPTKTEIRAYVRRVRVATQTITWWLDKEAVITRAIESEGADDLDVGESLMKWSEELTGCAGEVANLIEGRYA